MKITKSQLKQIIKEELQEGLGDFLKKALTPKKKAAPKTSEELGFEILMKQVEDNIYPMPDAPSGRKLDAFMKPETPAQENAKEQIKGLVRTIAMRGRTSRLSPAFLKKARDIVNPTTQE